MDTIACQSLCPALQIYKLKFTYLPPTKLTMVQADTKAIVQEVGLRDGLQAAACTMPTKDKIRWIDAAYQAGVRHMEIASFVPPRLLPQMADAAEVVTYAKGYHDLVITALVPNEKGALNALAAGVHRIVVPISVSHAHSLANVHKTPAAMVEEFGKIRTLIANQKNPINLVAGLSTVFGCTLQGIVSLQAVCDIVEKCLEAGADIIALADTTGHATPLQVSQTIAAVKKIAGSKFTSMHFHDTRGMGLPNTLVALEHGIREFDASLGGLGGCPNAPGATGNVVTEDLVYMLESMGYATGIDLSKLVAMRDIIRQALPNEPLYGFIARAGIPISYPFIQS